MILSVKSLRKMSVKCHRVMKVIENITNHTGPGYGHLKKLTLG